MCVCLCMCMWLVRKDSVQVKEAQQENIWTIGARQKDVNWQVNSSSKKQNATAVHEPNAQFHAWWDCVLIKLNPHFARQCLILWYLFPSRVNISLCCSEWAHPAFYYFFPLLEIPSANNSCPHTHSLCVYFIQPALWGPTSKSHSQLESTWESFRPLPLYWSLKQFPTRSSPKLFTT